MKTILLVAIFLLTTPLLANEAQNQTQQIKFITDFYKGVLDLKKDDAKFVAETPFFSESLVELTKKNAKICKEKSRGDDVCGFGATGDIFLNTQETGPNLNFATSKFKAHSIGLNLIEASFTVWPEESDYYNRKIKFRLVKENSYWRVDDINYQSVTKSMREQIKFENEAYEKAAQSLSETWSWVTIYLSNKDMHERVSKFIQSSVEVCGADSKCKVVKDDFKELKDTLIKFNDYYGLFSVEGSTFLKAKNEWPKPKQNKSEEVTPASGKVATVGPLTFTFIKDAWWLTKMELGKIGKEN